VTGKVGRIAGGFGQGVSPSGRSSDGERYTGSYPRWKLLAVL